MADCVVGRQKNQREDVEHQTSWSIGDGNCSERMHECSSIERSRPPSKTMIEAHNLTHLPAAPWCETCVQARGKSD